MSYEVGRSFGWTVGRWLFCHNFLKWRKVSLPCSYRSNYFNMSLINFIINKCFEKISVNLAKGYCALTYKLAKSYVQLDMVYEYI